jgi:hypothetical protein
MMFSHEQGIKVQVSEFFKNLLDSEVMEKKLEFYSLFYDTVLMSFLEYLEP